MVIFFTGWVLVATGCKIKKNLRRLFGLCKFVSDSKLTPPIMRSESADCEIRREPHMGTSTIPFSHSTKTCRLYPIALRAAGRRILRCRTARQAVGRAARTLSGPTRTPAGTLAALKLSGCFLCAASTTHPTSHVRGKHRSEQRKGSARFSYSVPHPRSPQRGVSPRLLRLLLLSRGNPRAA